MDYGSRPEEGGGGGGGGVSLPEAVVLVGSVTVVLHTTVISALLAPPLLLPTSAVATKQKPNWTLKTITRLSPNRSTVTLVHPFIFTLH